MASTRSLRLTICGLDEIQGHGTRAVTHVLSILDPEWPEPDFGPYGPHRRTLLRFHDAIEPAPSVILPTPGDVDAILAFGRAIEDDPNGPESHLLVHCHAGISRSSAAMTMILAQADPEAEEGVIVDRIATIRPQAWPNLRMIGFADDLLARGGRLTRAVTRLYGRRLKERPELAEIMTRLDRAREVTLGLASGAA
jgi:predicted protein tyrosine phosphatase